MKQKLKYRIYVLGEIPRNLKDKISALHSYCLLESRGRDRSVQSSEDKTAYATNGANGRAR